MDFSFSVTAGQWLQLVCQRFSLRKFTEGTKWLSRD
jgi:hypothetical protein